MTYRLQGLSIESQFCGLLQRLSSGLTYDTHKQQASNDLGNLVCEIQKNIDITVTVKLSTVKFDRRKTSLKSSKRASVLLTILLRRRLAFDASTSTSN